MINNLFRLFRSIICINIIYCWRFSVDLINNKTNNQSFLFFFYKFSIEKKYEQNSGGIKIKEPFDYYMPNEFIQFYDKTEEAFDSCIDDAAISLQETLSWLLTYNINFFLDQLEQWISYQTLSTVLKLNKAILIPHISPAQAFLELHAKGCSIIPLECVLFFSTGGILMG